MHTNINKRTKVCDVAYHTFQNHTGLQVGNGFYTFFKGCGFELGARVAPRLIQFFENVFHRRDTKGVADELFRVELAQ